MNITQQKLYATLRKAGYEAAKVKKCYLDGVEWKVEYNFGTYYRENASTRTEKLQKIQRVLLDAGIKCYPNTQETALIIGDPDA